MTYINFYNIIISNGWCYCYNNKTEKYIKKNMKNNDNLKIIPVVIYANASRDKFKIYEENRRKCGIYR